MIGAWEGNIEMMALFVGHGADVNRVSPIGEQALQLAAWKGRLEAVKWLVERGAAINRSGKHWSALHYAAFAGHRDIARFLLDQGAEVNARTPNDSTALMMTAREGHEELAGMLLEAGADRRPVNDWGDTALTWAMRHNNLRIARLVAAPAEFEQAVQAPPERFGTATGSVPAPPGVAELLRQIRFAEAQGRPSGDLRKAFAAAVDRLKGESTAMAIAGRKQPKAARPSALVITAKRRRPGSERAELVYSAKHKTESAPTEVSEILKQMRLTQAQGRPIDSLRKALFEAVAVHKTEGGSARR